MSKNKNNTFAKIRKIVQKVPEGKVTTYGQVATLIGTKNARIIGWAMHTNPDNIKTPCHRVIEKDGSIAETYAFGGWKVQKQKLENEGVTFKSERKVDLEKHLWQP